MQQFRSHISSSQNSASRFRMNLILFHQVPNSDKKSSSEEPNSLPTPSNYQVLFSHACFFFSLRKWGKTSDMEIHSHPKNLLETWSSFLLFVRLGVLATDWISEKSGQKSNMIISKRKHIVKQTGMEPRVSWMTFCIDKDIYHWNLWFTHSICGLVQPCFGDVYVQLLNSIDSIGIPK